MCRCLLEAQGSLLFTYAWFCKSVLHATKSCQLTEEVKGGPVKDLAIHRVLINLPVTRVHNGAMVTAGTQQREVGHVRTLSVTAELPSFQSHMQAMQNHKNMHCKSTRRAESS
jgi:hypothetical protein